MAAFHSWASDLAPVQQFPIVPATLSQFTQRLELVLGASHPVVEFRLYGYRFLYHNGKIENADNKAGNCPVVLGKLRKAIA